MNEFTQSLYDGWQGKLEADRIALIKEKAQKFYHGYMAAKKAFGNYEIQYLDNGIVRLHVDKCQLYGIAELKTFKQTCLSSYSHYLELIDMYIGSAIGDKAYLSMNIRRMAELQKAK